jgi:hypothetical protein
LASTSTPLPAQSRSDTAAVIRAAQSLFDAMRRQDTAGIRAVLLPQAQLFGTRSAEDSVVRPTGVDQFVRAFGPGGTPMLERMWEPEVRISGPVASIWARYDFHRGAQFSHCGVDAFHLIRRPDGWKIAAIVYTVQPNGCEASPLGPP